MALDELLSAARSLLGPVELVDDLSFSSRAAVARVRLSDGTTAVVKHPFEPDAYARETEAMRTLPA